MSVDDNLHGSRTLAASVAGERFLLYAAVNSRLLESFEGSGLGVRQSRFDATFGEGPASVARLNQQEFDTTIADPVADSGYLFASVPPAQVRRPKRLG
jgi:hypothetical protein